MFKVSASATAGVAALVAPAGTLLCQTVVLLVGTRRVLKGGRVATRGTVVAGLRVDVLVMAFTLIAGVGLRASLVEVIPVAVVAIDIERPTAVLPAQRTVEVVQAHILVVLMHREDILQVGIAAVPGSAEDIVATAHAHHVVQVDLIHRLVLRHGEVQLVSHLVTQEQRLVLGCAITHCIGRDGHRHHHCHKHHFLHSSVSFFILRLDIRFMFHAAKYGIPRDMTKGMFLIRPAKIPKPHRDSPHPAGNAEVASQQG